MGDMVGMDMSGGALPNEVSFPYGLPKRGRYRIFVQMKHGNTIETGVFDAMAQLCAFDYCCPYRAVLLYI